MTDIQPPVATNPSIPFAALVGSAARWGLTFVGSWLLDKGITDPGSSTAFVEAGVGIVMGLTALGWAMIQKWLAAKALHTALVLPAGSTVADLRAAGAKPIP